MRAIRFVLTLAVAAASIRIVHVKVAAIADKIPLEHMPCLIRASVRVSDLESAELFARSFAARNQSTFSLSFLAKVLELEGKYAESGKLYTASEAMAKAAFKGDLRRQGANLIHAERIRRIIMNIPENARPAFLRQVAYGQPTLAKDLGILAESKESDWAEAPNHFWIIDQRPFLEDHRSDRDIRCGGYAVDRSWFITSAAQLSDEDLSKTFRGVDLTSIRSVSLPIELEARKYGFFKPMPKSLVASKLAHFQEDEPLDPFDPRNLIPARIVILSANQYKVLSDNGQ